MIIQCEQCRTKFRLDDSRVSDKGVKVRCAKCRHIFTVVKEQSVPAPQEDFGSLLDQNSMKDESVFENPASMTAAAEETGFDDSSSGAEKDAFSGFDFESHDPFAEPSATSPAAEETRAGEAGSAPADDTDYSGFDFESNDPFADVSAAKLPAEEFTPEDSSVSGDAGFSAFGFESDPFADVGGTVPEAEESKPETASATSDDADLFGFTSDSDPFAEQDSIPKEPSFSASLAEPAAEDDFSAFDFTDMPTEGIAASGIDKREEPASNEHEEKMDDFFDFNDLKSPAPQAPEAAIAGGYERDPAAEAPSVSFVKPGQPVAETKPAFGEKQVASPMPHQEEFPPLSISSRRRQSSVVTAAIAVIGVLGASLAAFYGYSYFAQDKVKNVADTERIVIRTVDASFVKNQSAGDLLVITGEAQNSFKKPRAAIQIKGMVYGPDGQVVASKNAYAGNQLTKEQLATMPLDKIEAAMANQFGDSLSNLGVPPDKTIPFVIVIPTPPADAKDYGVEAAGSTVATGK